MADITVDDVPKDQSSPTHHPSSEAKPVVVGLYGLPGSGKTHLLNELKHRLGPDQYSFYDGSSVIANLVQGGLSEFEKLTNSQQMDVRARAIDSVGKECAESGKVALVAGQLSFWPEGAAQGTAICTRNDLNTYTHFIYLKTRPEVILERRMSDTTKARSPVSVTHLHEWQETEIQELRAICQEHRILLTFLSEESHSLNDIITLLADFRIHSKSYNLDLSSAKLIESIDSHKGEIKTVILLDADRTLAKEETGRLLWEILSHLAQCHAPGVYPLKPLYTSPLGYSYVAFRQTTLLYEETASDRQYANFCEEVASKVVMYPEITSLLQ